MKWFKHPSDTSDDPMNAELEEMFGLEGYARWMKILEAIAKNMAGKDSPCSVAYPWSKWQAILRGKPKTLLPFLKHLALKRRINLKRNGFVLDSFSIENENGTETKLLRSGDVLEIEAPVMASLRDEYSKKSGQTPDKLRTKEVEEEVEEEKEIEDPPLPPVGDTSPPPSRTSKPPRRPQGELYRFADWYAAYPLKEARGAAERAWAKLSKRPDFGDELVDHLVAAVKHAKQHSRRWADGYIPQPATWLNQRRWEDEFQAAEPGRAAHHPPAGGPLITTNGGRSVFDLIGSPPAAELTG